MKRRLQAVETVEESTLIIGARKNERQGRPFFEWGFAFTSVLINFERTIPVFRK
jgi:hypothetical protein